MSQYYFLVASLPYLAYEHREAYEPDSFIEILADHLTEAELKAVATARIDAPIDDEQSPDRPRGIHPTVERWEAFERGLRNTLVGLRATGTSGPSEYVRLDRFGHDNTGPIELSEAAREAFNHDSPLSGEDILNRVRWTHLDDLETGHFFDLDRIIIYFLKLQILARRRALTRQQGEERFAQINEQIMNDYYQEHNE